MRTMRPMRCFVGSHRLVYILRHASRLSKTPHFWGLRHAHPSEGYDPKIGTRSRFLCNAPTPKFHHPMFTRSEVIVLTNKHTNPQANRRRRKHPAFFATPRRWVISVMEILLLLFSFADVCYDECTSLVIDSAVAVRQASSEACRWLGC